MKIIGIGVDIIYNQRINKLINNKQFLNRVFTTNYHNIRK